MATMNFDVTRAARLLIELYGTAGATVEAATRATRYKANGDEEGLRAWQRVATVIDELRSEPAHSRNQ